MRPTQPDRRARRPVFFLSLAAAWLLAGSPAAGEAPLLSARTHVVVLVGLSGDAETESTYTRQTARLLELLDRASPRPASVTVLADAPALVTAPPALGARVVEASRAHLQETAAALAAEELVVFAWGHGGLRGKDPVFHVRGPRIEPADLAALAAKAARSAWFLLFRQSAAFARHLRAPERTLVTTEHETAYGDDPIGIELVLDAMRDRPAAGAEALARALGPATAAWYERNRLARTEEPTLWAGAGDPIRLAVESTAAAPAPAPRPDAPVAPTATAWESIAPATPAQYPGAPAVVLRRAIVHTIGAKPALESVVEEFVQILTKEGERYAELDLAWSPAGEAVHVLDLERRNRDGSIERLDPNLLTGPPRSGAGEELPMVRHVEALAGAEPGVIFRVRYKSEWVSFPLPHVYLEVPLAGPLPVEAMSVEVRAARDGAFHFGFRHHSRSEPERTEGAYGQSHRWHFAKIEALVPETLVNPSGTPALLVSTFPDWASFSAWYRRLTRLAAEVTPEIASTAAELTKNAATPREKVKRLAEFVTGFRYVAIPLGVNSHRPHAAANVLRNRYGDCKDKANLLNTMLASQGIAADLVLVPRFTQADEATPGLAFNHAISRVRLADETLWIDTTDETTRFGLLPPGDPGRKVLVIDETTAALTALPEPLAADHRLVLAIEVPLGGAPGAIAARTTGFVDYRLRQTARGLADAARNTPILALEHAPVAGVFTLAEQRSSDATDLDRPFEWSATGAWTGVAAAAPDGARWILAPFWIPAEWPEALHRRHSPLHLNDGYPLELEETVRFTGAGLSGHALPPPAAGHGDALRWSVAWTHEEGAIVARLRATLLHADLSDEGTRAFQRELRLLLEALATGVRVADRGDDSA
jgi:hypothetical protein